MRLFFCPRRLGGLLAVVICGWNAGAAESREAVLTRELPKLKTEYRAAAIKKPGRETEVSREYYQLLNRYGPLIKTNLRDWPAEPGAKYHKRDGRGEHDVRQNAGVALALAILNRYGEFDERVAGLSRAQAKAEGLAVLRYLTVTHFANFLPTGQKRPWGNGWQSAYWTRITGEAAWLLWDDLPAETQVMAARMIIAEANRYNTRPPDDGEWRDTKSEENAWNSEIIALAACMFPQHPNAKLWRERAIVYMMNSYSTAADHQDDRKVDGRRVRDWVTTVCVHPDFTVENHGLVHPDYMSGFNLLLHNAVLYKLAGEKVPESVFHHVMDTYEVLEHLTATNGPQFYLNGQDWWPHRMDNALEFGGFLSVYKRNPYAAFLERAALDTHKKMHARFTDGRQFLDWEHNYPNPDEDNMALYGDLYLANRYFGAGPKPVTAAEFQRKVAGTRIFETGGFVTHRTPEKFVSFSWVNGAMGLVFPSEDTWFTSPYQRGLVGNIKLKNFTPPPPPAKRSDPGIPELKVEAHTVQKLAYKPGGFVFVGKLTRSYGKVEQRVAMISLPDAPVLYVERVAAREAIEGGEFATAVVPVLNEEDQLFERNERRVWNAGGEHLMRGSIDMPAKQHVWQTGWVNLDEKLGVTARATGAMAYQENHQYEESRLEQFLSANYVADVGPKKPGELISEAVVLLMPNARRTDRAELETRPFGAGGLEVQFGRWQVIVNLNDRAVLNLPALSARVNERSR